MRNLKLLFIIVLLFTFVINENIFAKELKQIIERTFSVSSNELLELKTDAGDVSVSTWNKDEISVKVFGNKNAEKKFEFTFDETDFGLRVVGEKRGSGFFNWFKKMSLKYEIILPKKFNIEIKTAGGDLIIDECAGELEMKTSGGDIKLANSSGELNCATSGGDISVSDFLGDCDVSTSGGDIDMNSVDGDISASTSGGDIFIVSQAGKLKAKTSGGDIQVDYNGMNDGIYLSTSGGDIKVKLPSTFKADVELKTSGGKVYNNFENSYGSKVTKRKFIGTYNSGGESLVAKTSGGRITISEN
ncbi:MAG: DUF4097 family beta strand repeat-containing protein [Melioribacteraceae bacterium]